MRGTLRYGDYFFAGWRFDTAGVCDRRARYRKVGIGTDVRCSERFECIENNGVQRGNFV